MTSLRDVVDKISDRLEPLGIASATVVPESVNPPAAFVEIGAINRAAFRLGSMQIPFDLVILTAKSTTEGQLALYDFLNPDADDDKSIWAAFETSPDFGFTDVDVKLLTYRPLGIVDLGGYSYYGGAIGGVITLTSGA